MRRIYVPIKRRHFIVTDCLVLLLVRHFERFDTDYEIFKPQIDQTYSYCSRKSHKYCIIVFGTSTPFYRARYFKEKLNAQCVPITNIGLPTPVVIVLVLV